MSNFLKIGVYLICIFERVPESDFMKFFIAKLNTISSFKLAFYDQQLLEILKSWTF